LVAALGGVDPNALLNQANPMLLQQLAANNQLNLLGNDNSLLIKDKINDLFEQAKKEEEKRRKLEEEYQMRVSFRIYLFLINKLD
jgi:hypothetical protein